MIFPEIGMETWFVSSQRGERADNSALSCSLEPQLLHEFLELDIPLRQAHHLDEARHRLCVLLLGGVHGGAEPAVQRDRAPKAVPAVVAGVQPQTAGREEDSAITSAALSKFPSFTSRIKSLI